MTDEQPNIPVRCSTCTWWVQNPNAPTYGECRAGPPMPKLVIHATRAEADAQRRTGFVTTVWPGTAEGDLCRAWMPSMAAADRLALERQQDVADAVGRH